MNQDIRTYLRKTCTIVPQPYNPNLRNISRIIAEWEDDASCMEVLKEYLALCGVPVREGEAAQGGSGLSGGT